MLPNDIDIILKKNIDLINGSSPKINALSPWVVKYVSSPYQQNTRNASNLITTQNTRKNPIAPTGTPSSIANLSNGLSNYLTVGEIPAGMKNTKGPKLSLMAMLSLGKAFQSPPGLGLTVPSSLRSWFSTHIRALWGIAACTLPTLAYRRGKHDDVYRAAAFVRCATK